VRLFDDNKCTRINIERINLETISVKDGVSKEDPNDEVEILSIVSEVKDYIIDNVNIIKSVSDCCGLGVPSFCEYYLPSQDSFRNGCFENELHERYLRDIFKYGSTLIKTARALEIDEMLDRNYKISAHSSCKIDGYDGVFSSVKNINDIKIERESIWAKNFIRKWKENPVFFIFDNKYDKI
ncbi:uncharacterized protein VICG_01217, partial [Vittaforma corneae ATCC 50505]